MLQEYRFILDGSLTTKKQDEYDLVDSFFNTQLDWYEIAGQIFNHRLGGYLYKGLSNEQRRKMPKELREALKFLVFAQRIQAENSISEFKPILKVLEEKHIEYAGLKGLIFNADFYELGSRRSNDIDILVPENQLEVLDKVLRSFGYIQSLRKDNNLIEASKKEKLIQRMNYHDLVPYVKETAWGISEIDINFLFDSKENIIDKEIFDYGTVMYNGDVYSVRGLSLYTHLAHLCVHFHREATNTLWTTYNRDVALYKVVDIMNTIRVHRNELVVYEWVALMKKLNLQNKCYYTFYVLTQFYDDSLVNALELALRPEDTSFLDDIKVEGEDRTIKRTEKFIKSAFSHIR